MRTFTLNEKQYNAVAFGFNTVCDLEDMGVSLEQMGAKPTSALRAYVAICGGFSKDQAGVEIEEHLKNGENLDELNKIILTEVKESDFFRSLNKGTEEKTSTSKTKKN